MLAHTCITYFTYCLQITINILNTLALYAFLRDIRTWTYHHELRIVQHVRPRRDNVVLYADFNWYCLGFLFLNWTSSCEFPLKCNCHNSSCHSSEVRYEVFTVCCPGLQDASCLTPVRLHFELPGVTVYESSRPCSSSLHIGQACCVQIVSPPPTSYGLLLSADGYCSLLLCWHWSTLY